MASPTQNPYMGPRSFEEKHSSIFFGRGEETRQLASLVIAQRAVLLYAQSGAGKTSLINAGLVPRLKQRKGIRVFPIIQIAGDLPPEVAGARVKNIYVFNTLLGLAGDTTRTGELYDLTLSEGLKGHFSARPDQGHVPPWLLVLDQFEELFTTGTGRSSERADFFLQLQNSLIEYPQLSLLLSIREEYIAQLNPYAAQLPDRLRSRFRLELLGETAAREAIQKPAHRGGVQFADPAARMLVDDLRRVRVQQPDGTMEEQRGTYVEPMQLQVVCRGLWDRLPADATEITEADVKAMGDVHQALAGYYANRVGAIAGKTGVRERTIRDWFDHHLITDQGLRGQVLQSSEQSQGLDNRAIYALVEAHLVRAEKRRGVTWFELAHDRLIEPVLADNAEWRKANFNVLQRRAELWGEQDRRDDFLLHGQALTEAQDWENDHPDEVTPTEREFLDACREVRSREAARRNRRLAIGAMIFSAVVIVLAVFAWSQSRVAKRAAEAEAAARATAEVAREQAEQQSRIARSRALAGQAEVAASENSQLAVLLGLEAVYQTHQDVPGTMTAEAGSALHRALAQARLQIILHGGDDRSVLHAAWSSDEGRIATANSDGSVKVWDVAVGTELSTLSGHGCDAYGNCDVNHVAWSSDDARIVTASSDGSAKVWDATTGTELFTFGGHGCDEYGNCGVTYAAWSLDDARIVTASYDGSAKVWDALTGVEIFALSGHNGPVLHTEWNSDDTRIVTASSDGSAKVWDATTGAEVFTFSEHTDEVWHAAWSSDAGRIVTSSWDGNAKVWDGATGTELFTLSGHLGPVWHAAWSSDDMRIVTSSTDGSAKVWDTVTGAELFTLSGHTDWVRQAAWSSDDTRIVTASRDGSTKVWNAATGAELFTLSGHTDEVWHAAWNSGDTRIVTASSDGSARVWDASASPEIFTLSGHIDEVWSAAWSSDNRRIVTASGDGSAKVWDVATGAELLTLGGHTSYVLHAVWNSDDTRVLTASGDGSARVWDAATGAEFLTLSGHTDKVWYATWNSDDTRIVTASGDGSAKVWDATTGAEILSLGGHADEVWHAAWSSDDARIVTASTDGSAKVWDAATGAELHTFGGHIGEVWHAAWNSDDTRIVTAGSDGTARVWDAVSGAELFTLSGHTDWIRHTAWRSDDRRILTASGDGSAKVWDAIAGAEIFTLHGHSGPIRHAAWSPDGTHIVTASGDGTAKVWDAATGVELFTVSGHTDEIWHAAWSSDGTRIVTASSDGSARIHFAEIDGPGGLIEFTCARVGQNLTQAEWERYVGSDFPYRKTCPDLPEGQ